MVFIGILGTKKIKDEQVNQYFILLLYCIIYIYKYIYFFPLGEVLDKPVVGF